jgi:hypothetical protein
LLTISSSTSGLEISIWFLCLVTLKNGTLYFYSSSENKLSFFDNRYLCVLDKRVLIEDGSYKNSSKGGQ